MMLLRGHRPPSLKDCMTAVKHGARRCTTTLTEATASSGAQYPPILDLSFRAVKKRKEEEWHAKIRSLSTIEEKLFELNMPRYYGWKSVLLEEHCVRYDTLNFAQHITRTHIVSDSQLPEFYDKTVAPGQFDDITKSVKNAMQDDILFAHAVNRQRHAFDAGTFADEAKEKDELARTMVRQINRTMLNELFSECEHLSEAQTDLNPRIEAFWFAGGMEPPTDVRKSREGLSWYKEYVDDPVDRPIQYIGSPILHLRHDLPLQEVVSLGESENPTLTVPQFKLDPRHVGYCMKRRHATNVPGFWPGDPCEFGLLSYHSRNRLLEHPKGRDDELDALSAQALLASYARLFTQACYQGFSTFDDLSYPLVTQTILTDGQWWSFCVYQLNTTLVHGDHAIVNPRRNLFWTTRPTKLFDEVDVESGTVRGFNDDVVKNLLRFYMNAPSARTGVEMKPHLGKSVKVIADIAEDERRNWLESQYKHLVSVRPRHRRIPEIYHWQKIYMIDQKTRPMEKRRDLWQFNINPFKRRLDDHTPQYVPRKLRERPDKRSVGRWKKTYYP